MMNKERTNKDVFSNSAWLIFAKVVNIVVGLAVSICVTRYLGVENKGVMANAFAISSFWGFIASSGLMDLMISGFTKEKGKSANLAASGMLIMFVGGLLAFVLSVINAIVLGHDRVIIIFVTIYSTIYLFQCFSIFEYWFCSNSKSKYYAISQSVIHIIFLIIRFIGVPIKAPLSFFIVAAALETICVNISAFICYKTSKCRFIGIFSPSRETVRNLLKIASPIIVMGFATSIYMKVDQIMVGRLMGDAELGVYSVAVTLAEYWYFVPAAIYSSFLPSLTESFPTREIFGKKLQLFTDIMTTIGYLAIIAVFLLGRIVIVLLYGIDFEKSAYILMVYIGSGLFTCLSYSAQAYYIIQKDTKSVMWINLIGALLNFILNIIFIYKYGSIGAALATLLEYMMVAFGQMVVLRKKYGELYLIQLKAFFPFVRMGKFLKSAVKKENKY